jgi:thiopeptide-type bacteriocin biosynthesis protein
MHTAPLARFLAEVATARCGEYGPIDFGAASHLPHLPRVRLGRSVLSPARWLLTTNHLSPHDWDDSLTRWRERWHVPSTVLLCQADLRLPLDLHHQLHRELLRTRLKHAGHVELREDVKTGWPERPCEFLVSLTAATDSAGPTPAMAKPAEPLLPGASAFLHAQLEGHPARFNEVLTDHLPRLLDELASHVQVSWFRRDHDTTRPDSDHYLGLYLRLFTPEDYGPTSSQLARWFGQVSALGILADLHLAPYRPQHGRYGERATRAAEQVFAADSAAALAELAMATRAGLPTDAIAAASLADLAASFGTNPADGWQRLTELIPHEQGKLDRSLRTATLALTNRAVVCRHPGGGQVVARWDERRAALADYRDQLALERDPTTVLRSLLHDHYVRTVGVDPDRERIVNRLARTIALRQLAVPS